MHPTIYIYMHAPSSVSVPVCACGVRRSADFMCRDTFACTPFVRGWHLDAMVAAATEGEQARARIADAMLRFSLHQPFVGQLVTAARNIGTYSNERCLRVHNQLF